MGLDEHAKDYKRHAWDQYTIMELGNWVHNFVKKSEQRANKVKATKDLHYAKNYCFMMEQKIKEMADKLEIDWKDL